MKLKIRRATRQSQQEIDKSFDPINLNTLFEESDPLFPWLEEIEQPLLDSSDIAGMLNIGDDNCTTSQFTSQIESRHLQNESSSSANSDDGDEGGNGNDDVGITVASESTRSSQQEEPSYSRIAQDTQKESELYGHSVPSHSKKQKDTRVTADDSSSIIRSFGDFGVTDTSESYGTSDYQEHSAYGYDYDYQLQHPTDYGYDDSSNYSLNPPAHASSSHMPIWPPPTGWPPNDEVQQFPTQVQWFPTTDWHAPVGWSDLAPEPEPEPEPEPHRRSFWW